MLVSFEVTINSSESIIKLLKKHIQPHPGNKLFKRLFSVGLRSTPIILDKKLDVKFWPYCVRYLMRNK